MRVRGLVLAAAASLAAASTAQAGVVLTLVPSAPPFTTTGSNAAVEKAYADANLTGYILRITSDNTARVASVDIGSNAARGIFGAMHQRWAFNPDTEVFSPSPNVVNTVNIDSHLLAGASAIFVNQAAEDNTGAGSGLTDTASADYGMGTFLKGSWGIAGGAAGASYDAAYVVLKNSDPQQLTFSGLVSMTDGSSTNLVNATVSATPVPEPAALSMLGLGAVGLLARRRRKA